MPAATLKQKTTLLSCALSLVLWRLYLITMSPAFPPDDSPETIAAGFKLGIQHAPGYPLHTLLGRLACVAWPVGSPAWRVGNLSALLALVCVLCLGALVRQVLQPHQAQGQGNFVLAVSLAAGAWLGFCAPFWAQATQAKGGIYLLNLGLSAAGLLALFQALRRGEAGDSAGLRAFFLLGCLFLGLGLSNHYMSQAGPLLLACVLAFLFVRQGRLSRLDLALSAVAAAAGMSLYLVLLLRGRQVPCLGVFNPKSLGDLWWLAGREGYASFLPKTTWVSLAARLGAWKDAVQEAGGVPLVLFTLGGLVWAWERERKWMAICLGLYGTLILGAVMVNQYFAGNLSSLRIFILPSTFILILVAAAGLAAVAGTLKRVGNAVFLVLAFVGAVYSAAWNFPFENRHDDFTAYDFSRGLLLDLPERALLLAKGDFYHLPPQYAQFVEGRRPDLTVVQSGLSTNPKVLADLDLARPDLAAGATGAAVPRLFTPEPNWPPKEIPGAGDCKIRGLVKQSKGKSGAWGEGYFSALPLRVISSSPYLSQPYVFDLCTWYQFCWIQKSGEYLREGNLKMCHKAMAKARQIPGKLHPVS